MAIIVKHMNIHAPAQKRQHDATVPSPGATGRERAAPGVGVPLFMQTKSRASTTGTTLQRQCAYTRPARANDICETCSSDKRLQAQLTIGASDDPLEQEADRVADQVLAISPLTAVGEAPLHIQRFMGQADTTADTAPASVDRVLAGSGRPLEPALQHDMESRFGHDFSQVRVHSDSAAAQSAREISAHAYTVGHDIVFGQDRFAPESPVGQRLLAHELTHVVQQSEAVGAHSGPAQNGGAHASAGMTVQRFSDLDHHIIEEVALKKLFTPEQLEAIEKGNTQRDYSQVPASLNALFLGQMTQFGGYVPQEHFDYFVFDRANDRWVSQDAFDKIWDDRTRQWTKRRVPLAPKPGKPRMTAPQYIEAQLLAAVQNDMPDASAFEHLGNAFHTIEDFFAHSNFVELTQRDYSAGEELATHASHVPGPDSQGSILGTVSDPASTAFFNDRFRKAQAAASPLSHGRLAKDFHGNPNHTLAITLAALVIRQVGLMLKEAFALKTWALREEFVRTTIVATLSRYLRPPSDQDKWWESLLADDGGVMRRRIQTLQNKTPVTVNQTPSSPLRNIEATRYSSWKAIGVGTSLSFPLGEGKFLTVGHMLSLPGTGTTPLETNLVLPPYVSTQDEKVRLISGLQFSGSFDETTWFGK